MATNKTGFTNESVNTFIEGIDNEQKRTDSRYLIELMTHVSGEEPRMFGPTIVGFGEYRYKYDSGHEGTAPLIGFSPRKAAISLYRIYRPGIACAPAGEPGKVYHGKSLHLRKKGSRYT
ncbi:MAG: DUF1801 domain-containing protein [Leadbetterella sp.]|nr:DUF1801 domain-containing protein [Leadbetterella sp.]